MIEEFMGDDPKRSKTEPPRRPEKIDYDEEDDIEQFLKSAMSPKKKGIS